MPSKFYCHMGVFDPAEGTRHREMTNRLVSAWSSFVEIHGGYKFFFNPSKVSASELMEWAANEKRCCPFFNFEIKSEPEGKVLSLELTGDEGINPSFRLSSRCQPRVFLGR